MQILGLTQPNTTLDLTQNTPVGYSALVYSLNNGSTVFYPGGVETINGESSYYETAASFVALLTMSVNSDWSLVSLAAGSSPPTTDVRTITTSTTVDDSYWDDAGSAEDTRLPVVDAAVLADSASAITVTLGGGGIFAKRVFDIVQAGAGTVTIEPATNFTLNGGSGSVTISAQWKKARVYYTNPGSSSGDFVVVVD